MQKPTGQYAILGVLLLWAAIAQLTFSSFAVYVQSHPARNVHNPFAIHEYSRRIGDIPPPYRNSGLKLGDEVMAVGGQPVHGLAQLHSLRFQMHPGDILDITVRRHEPDGSWQILRIPVRIRAFGFRTIDWTMVLGLQVLLPISCLAIGFYIALMRPRDPLAWITLVMLASFGQIVPSEHYWAIWQPWRTIYIAYHGILQSIWPLCLALFALYFPKPFGFIRKRPWIGWLIALPFLALCAVTLCGDLLAGNHIDQLHWLQHLMDRIGFGIFVLFSIYISTFFASLSIKRAVLHSPDEKRRLRVMFMGCSLAFGPLLVIVLSELDFIPVLPAWLESLCLLMLLFFPFTIAYVIVVQRAMDVRMVVRSGVKYAVASNGVKVLRVAVAAVIIGIAINLVHESANRLEIAAIVVAGMALILVLGRLSDRASRWLDRRFFREAYDTEVILTELGNSVAGIHDTKALLETVTRTISSSLHVPKVAALLNEGHSLEPVYSIGFDGTPPQFRLGDDSATSRMMRQTKSAARIFFDDPQSWVHGAPEKEQEILQSLETRLLLPLTVKDRVLGLISLGPKRSEVPYSSQDIRLLSAVSSQTGLALENAQLTERIRREVAQRERLNRELEIAREVQQRLFPQKLPEVQGLDFAGYCRPARGVGGDYYDFIHLPGDAVGIAIGDVAGKGIGAALMMACLQASLRSQTIRPGPNLAEIIQDVNYLVYESSASNSYITFFYAQYHPEKRLLRYVNAGHNPPVLYRRCRDEVRRLEEGGIVIGLLPKVTYQESSIELQHGDTLVAFTDGVSEAMNRAEEEWGEERLIEAIRSSESRSAADLAASIVAQADSFTAGAPQHDDMTLVVMQVR